MPETAPLLEARGIDAGYDGETIVEGVDLAVHASDFLAVIGPNGGGKTTLLKVLLGLLAPSRGEVVHRHSGRPGALGYVPQFATFEARFPIRVEEVVTMGRLGSARRRGGDGRRRWPFGARLGREDREAVAAVLDRFGLTGVAASPVGELSGGQLQRTLIARAVVGDPEVLFLDEPLASVDAEFRERLVDVLAEVNRGIPVVVVTHDLTPFAGVVRQIACVNRRLFYHPEGQVTPEALEEVYGCPVELVSHGVPHRVLAEHEGGGLDAHTQDPPHSHGPRP